jgi:hypothetical protein
MSEDTTLLKSKFETLQKNTIVKLTNILESEKESELKQNYLKLLIN